ncbi:MAG: SMC-Scp complex subunit ScpB [Nevskiales bacterium]
MTEEKALEEQAAVDEVNSPAAEDSMVDSESLPQVLEALLLSSESALTIDQLISSFGERKRPDKKQIRDALHQLDEQLTGRAVELREVANGWRVQVRQDYSPYIGRLWEERPPRYSRALLETLALIVYRQPISRGEIEEIRGVSLSPNIIKTLIEREWVKVVGVREAPGRPELLGTSKTFLDDFNIKTLNQLPSLPEIRDPDALGEALQRLGIDPEELAKEEAGDDSGDTSGEEQGDMLVKAQADAPDMAFGEEVDAELEAEEEQDSLAAITAVADAIDAENEAKQVKKADVDEQEELAEAQSN